MSKKAISATIDEELINWINKKLEDKTKYRNKSHLIEIALEKLKGERHGQYSIRINNQYRICCH